MSTTPLLLLLPGPLRPGVVVPERVRIMGKKKLFNYLCEYKQIIYTKYNYLC